MWGRFEGGELVAACHVGANLVPVAATRRRRPRLRRAGAGPGPDGVDDRRAAGRRRGLLEQRRRHLGPAARGALGPAAPRDRRRARWSRPTPSSGGRPARTCDAALSRVRRDVHRGGRGLARVRRAAPTSTAPGSPSWSTAGWSFARFDDKGRLVFKAEVACATPYAAQIQGVFVPADRRGQGLAAAGHGGGGQLVRREIAPVVSLYVNDWNTAARARLRAGRLPRDRALRHRDVLSVRLG